jgi:hypothetical protein
VNESAAVSFNRRGGPSLLVHPHVAGWGTHPLRKRNQMLDLMNALPGFVLSRTVELTLVMWVMFYLVAGYRTWQVIMLTADKDDETAKAWVNGTLPIYYQAFFIAGWLPILIVTTCIALCERESNRG